MAGIEKILEIAPNRSLSPRGARLFYGSLVAGTVLVSGTVAALGYWPVLPFAGLELAVLGYALWSVQRGGRYREVVRISERTVVVEKGQLSPEERVEFDRHWSRVELRRRSAANSLTRLELSSQGSRCELGRCLSETERQGLARRLNECIGPLNASPDLALVGAIAIQTGSRGDK